jgi:hypothetical protein
VRTLETGELLTRDAPRTPVGQSSGQAKKD